MKIPKTPCQFGSTDTSKGQETIKPEDLIPAAEVPRQMGKREAEKDWVIGVGTVRRLRGDTVADNWEGRRGDRLTGRLNRFSLHLATL